MKVFTVAVLQLVEKRIPKPCIQRGKQYSVIFARLTETRACTNMYLAGCPRRKMVSFHMSSNVNEGVGRRGKIPLLYTVGEVLFCYCWRGLGIWEKHTTINLLSGGGGDDYMYVLPSLPAGFRAWSFR